MIDVREFGTNQLFGITIRDHWLHCGYRVAVLGNRFENGGLVPNLMSAEGVVGAAQVMRFDSEQIAQAWIDQFANQYGYDPGDMRISKSKVTSRFMKMPVANFNHPCWVNVRKWDSLSERKKMQLAELAPEYFDDDAAGPETQNARPYYRGFRF